jgi:hypothetical protein
MEDKHAARAKEQTAPLLILFSFLFPAGLSAVIPANPPVAPVVVRLLSQLPTNH